MEIWKDVVGYEGLYKVSSYGKIYSVRRNREMYLNKGSHGYLTCTFKVDKKNSFFRVHGLVVKAFIDSNYKYEKGLVIDHINRCKTDNRVENLRIVTSRENSINVQRRLLLGVTADSNRFRSQIMLNNKKYYLGLFKTEIEAHNKYIEAYDLIKKGIFDYDKLMIKKLQKFGKYDGVYYKGNINKWHAIPKINNKRKYIGVFFTEEEAYKAVINAETANR